MELKKNLTEKEEKKLEIDCPRCKQKTIYHKDNKFRPFCSKACQDSDFLGWAEERYQIPSKDDTSESLEDEEFFDEDK